MPTKRTRTSEPALSAPAAAPVKKHRVARAQAPRKAASEPADATASIVRLAAAVSHEEVARLAYSYWEARGCQGGDPQEDWLRAERELRARAASAG